MNDTPLKTYKKLRFRMLLIVCVVEKTLVAVNSHLFSRSPSYLQIWGYFLTFTIAAVLDIHYLRTSYKVCQSHLTVWPVRVNSARRLLLAFAPPCSSDKLLYCCCCLPLLWGLKFGKKSALNWIFYFLFLVTCMLIMNIKYSSHCKRQKKTTNPQEGGRARE